MFCSNCGQKLPEDAAFCVNCGAPTEGSAPPPAPKKDHDFSVPILAGALGIIFCCSILGHFLSIGAIVMGYKEYKEKGEKLGMWLGIAGESVAVLITLLKLAISFLPLFFRLVSISEYFG